MFSFLKSKKSGADIAAGVFDSIQQQYKAGFPQLHHLLPEDLQIDRDAVRQELLYLEIFIFDFATYNALGQTPTRANVLISFLGHVRLPYGERVAPSGFTPLGGRGITPSPAINKSAGDGPGAGGTT
jgi:hypothetical protein